ncbi:type I-F CRISPR-associated protein Csy1 [Bacterioplanoides pacificum]|uniref:Type I-F CRISPR-associated protein Csy1 n=1 Tax=Bacterioplanoides pacificum TaxID=1171596 RepID=A0ABV7VUI9_9GAMM
MPDPVIHAFFEERKKAWLSKELKSSKDEQKIRQKKLECEELYSRENWLRFAFENSYKRSLVSHVSKMTHPDTGSSKTSRSKKTFVTPIIFEGKCENDGLLRTGNVKGIDLDSTGNGTEVNTIGEVGALLSLVLSDGRRFYDHLINDSSYLDDFLKVDNLDLQKSKESLKAMFKEENQETNSRIKQVYFPLNNSGDYHQLSLLTNSGIVFECRKRLDAIRFGIDEEEVGKNTYEADVLTKDELKQARDKRRKNEYFDQPFDEIYGLTTIGYGGTKPQNISVLNNQNGGKAHLLLSVPPALEQRDVQFPKKDFFQSNIRYSHGREAFRALNQIFLAPKSDGKIPLKNLRSGRDNRLQQLTDLVIDSMWQVRRIAKTQYREDTSLLPRYQKIWLLDEFSELRQQQDDWLAELTTKIRDWIITGHQRTNKEAAVLGDAEIQFIQSFVEQYQEAFR